MGFHDLESERLSFRKVRLDDVSEIHDYASNPSVKKYIGWRLKENIGETLVLINTMLEREEAGTHHYASVIEKNSGRIIGTMILFGFDQEAGHGEIGYVFHENSWGKGFGTEAVSLATAFAKEELKLKKLYGRVVDVNGASAAVLKKNGFELEAVLKDHFFIDGGHCACEFYSKYF